MDDSGDLDDRYRYPIVAHSDTGDPDCGGCIFPVFRENEADITCNECGSIIKTVPADQAVDAMMEMALAQESCIATCPHCGQENVFPGFSEMFTFMCQHCGKASNPQASPQDPDDFPDFKDELEISGRYRVRRAVEESRLVTATTQAACTATAMCGHLQGPCDCPVCNGSGFENEGPFQPN